MRVLAAALPLWLAALGASYGAQPEGGRLYGQWMHACAEGPCQVYLSVTDAATEERRLTWSFVHDRASAQISAIINVQLGVALPLGLNLAAGDEDMPVPFQVCVSEGCRAVLEVDEDILSRLTDADTVSVQYVPYGRDYRVSIDVPTEGLGEALTQLRRD